MDLKKNTNKWREGDSKIIIRSASSSEFAVVEIDTQDGNIRNTLRLERLITGLALVSDPPKRAAQSLFERRKFD